MKLKAKNLRPNTGFIENGEVIRFQNGVCVPKNAKQREIALKHEGTLWTIERDELDGAEDAEIIEKTELEPETVEEYYGNMSYKELRTEVKAHNYTGGFKREDLVAYLIGLHNDNS